jgi:hypothetical protein
MIVLGDRNFAAADLIAQIAATGAEVLIRVKTGRTGHKLPVCGRLRDGSYLSQIGPTQVRVIDAAIIITTEEGPRRAVYRLITTVLDPDCSAEEIVRLYHQRWGATRGRVVRVNSRIGGRSCRVRSS